MKIRLALMRQFIGLVMGFVLCLLLLNQTWPIFATAQRVTMNVAEERAPALSVVQDELAAAPVLHYQARLLDPVSNQPKADGVYPMTFRIYNVATGGAPLWSEQKNMNVANGRFSTLLGDATPLPSAIFNGQDLWLGVQVAFDLEAIPRQRLAHVAYAFYAAAAGSATAANSAANADKVDGQDATAFAQTSHTHSGETWSGSNNPLQMQGSYASAPLVLNNSTGSGLQVDNAGFAGVYIGSAGQDGFYVHAATDDGLGVNSPTDDGVSIGYPGNDGIMILSPADDGIQMGDGTSFPTYGLFVPDPGTRYTTLIANTAYPNGEWALFTPDKISAANVVVGSLTLIAKVDGAELLTHGDVVAAVGVGGSLPSGQDIIPLVRRADASLSPGVIGVVEGKLAFDVEAGKKQEGVLIPHRVPEAAVAGDYVALTVLGIADVKVEPGLALQPGQRLTIAATTGFARALYTRELEGMTVTEGAPVIGIALDKPDPTTGMALVFVTLR